MPSLEEILLFSDSAVSQFKQRYLLHNLTRIPNYFNLFLSWHFFATSHAKRVLDTIGGTIKTLVWQQILTKKHKCENAADLINIAKTRTKVIIIKEITQENIDESITQLHGFFSNAVKVRSES